MQVDKNGAPQLVDDETGEVLAEVFFKTPHNHDTLEEAKRGALVCTDDHKTDQSFKDEVDINTIMDRVARGAEIPVTLPEHFGDGTAIPTLYEARMRIAENNATFYNLAPDVRAEFMNDPGLWEQQVIKDLDAGNLDDLERMGVNVKDLRVYRINNPPAAPQGASPAPGAPAPTTPPGGPPATT